MNRFNIDFQTFWKALRIFLRLFGISNLATLPFILTKTNTTSENKIQIFNIKFKREMNAEDLTCPLCLGSVLSFSEVIVVPY